MFRVHFQNIFLLRYWLASRFHQFHHLAAHAMTICHCTNRCFWSDGEKLAHQPLRYPMRFQTFNQTGIGFGYFFLLFAAFFIFQIAQLRSPLVTETSFLPSNSDRWFINHSSIRSHSSSTSMPFFAQNFECGLFFAAA